MVLYLFLTILFLPSPVQAHSEDRSDFNILDYGAVPDGETLNTSAIQKAIDAAHQYGGGRVVVPAGQFLTGSVIIKSGVDLHIERNGTLLGSTDPGHYIHFDRWKALVIARDAHHISLSGMGIIDGQGQDLALHIDSLFYAGSLDSTAYNFIDKRPKIWTRPQLVEFVGCTDITVKNLTLKNASGWVQTYDLCKNLVIDSIKVDSDVYWNNDGIDIADCTNVRITNCSINASDDGICFKSERPDQFCDSIYVAHCSVRSSASAVKFGTTSRGGFKNIHVEHIRIHDTYRSAIAIECVDGGFIENIKVDQIHATNTGNAIFIKLGNRQHKKNKNGVGYLKNISIRNVSVQVSFQRPDYAYNIRGPSLPFFHNIIPSSITGLPGYPVQNIHLENIEIIYPGRGNKGMAYVPLSQLDRIPEMAEAYPEFSMFGELPAWGLYIRHAERISMRNVTLKCLEMDYRPALVFDDVHNVNVNELTIKGDSKAYRVVLKDVADFISDSNGGILKL